MGRWMESRDLEGKIVDEIAPNPLIYCSKYLPKSLGQEFPIISRLDLLSENWIDEMQELKSDEISSLYSELRRLRRISQLKEFISGLDNKKFWEYWKDGKEESDFNDHLDLLEEFLLNAMNSNLELKVYL